jgi:hypothetical protein
MRRTKTGVIFVAIIFAGCAVPVEAQQKPASKATIAKKTTPAPDFSALVAFRDSLLDLKGAVEAGVNREDYQRKLQTAVGESLKADARLPDGEEDKPGTVKHCFAAYRIALFDYQISAAKWSQLLIARRGNEEGLPGYDDDRVSKAQEDLQASWKAADHALDEARTCTKAKAN